MKNIIIFAFIANLLFIFIVKSNGDNIDAVKEVINKFSDLTTASADIFDRLSYFGPKALAMLKLTGPISTLILEGMLGIFKGDSEELRAIHLLHDNMKDKFVQLSYKTDSIILTNEYNHYLYNYNEKITIGIKLLSLEFEFLSNSSFHTVDPSIKNNLKNQCKGTNSVLNMLTWLENVIDTNCIIPTIFHTKNYVQALEMANFIETKLLNNEKLLFHTNTTVFKIWKTATISRLTYLPEKIQLLKRYFDEEKLNTTDIDNTHHLIQKIDYSFLKAIGYEFFDKNPFSCLMSTLSIGFNKKRKALMDFAEIILTDLSKILFLGMVCSSVEDNNIQAKMRIDYYERIVEAITKKMKDWITSDLAISWPEVYVTFTKKLLLEESNEEKNYEKIADKITHESIERGLDRFFYQVIVLPNWKYDDYVKVICNDPTCLKIEQKNIRVIITRIDMKETNFQGITVYQRIEQSYKWILERQAVLKSSLVSSAEAGLSLDGILNNFYDTIKMPLVTPSFYRTFIIINNRTWLKSSCFIPTGLSLIKLGGTDCYFKFEYLDTSLVFNDKKYLIMFLI